MYAIVDILGYQFKVKENEKVNVPLLDKKEGEKVIFSEVLLIDEDGKVSVGNPTVKGRTVEAKVLEHLKGEKVLVFKKKRRTGYQKLNGHRQNLSKIVIEKIK